MNAELMDLGRRAVACKGWRWMPGMLDLWGQRILAVGRSGGILAVFPAGFGSGRGGRLPDLSDPATLGPMAALVIERHPTARIQLIQRIDSGERHAIVTWEASDGRTHSTGKRPTAEALVIALEAAP